MVAEIDVEEARLIWRRSGRQPVAADFEGDAASVWSKGTEAIHEAVQRQAQHAGEGEEPWIRVGEVVYNPAQIRELRRAETDEKSGQDEAMPDDEPWE